MKKAGQVLLTISMGTFVLLFCWIIINSIFLGKDVLYEFNPLLLILFISLDIVISIFLYKKIIPMLIKYKWLPVVLLIIFTILCIVISYNLRLNPSWDMGRVYNMAVQYTEEGHISDSYLYEYQNNIAITCVYIVIFKIFSIFNFTDYITIATFANAIMVSLTVFCLYHIMKKISGKKNALMLLIICLFTTPLYLHSAIYYTDTMSMFLCSLFILIYVYMKDEEKSRKKIILQILLGIVFLIGFEVKITSSFIFIAILFVGLLNKKFKGIINNFKFFLPTAIVCFLIYTVFTNVVVIPDKEKLNTYKVPISHWLWIGSIGNGGYNEEAFLYTYSFNNYEEKNKADLEKFKESLKSYNIGSFIEHINEKLKYTWADGTYLAPEKIRRNPVNKGTLYQFVSSDGDKKDYYKYLPQTMHFTMLIFLLVSAVSLLKNKDYNNIYTVFTIAVLGIAVFLMIWENRSRYILTLVPVMLMLEVRGIEIISNRIKKGEVQNEENISSYTNVL